MREQDAGRSVQGDKARGLHIVCLTELWNGD